MFSEYEHDTTPKQAFSFARVIGFFVLGVFVFLFLILIFVRPGSKSEPSSYTPSSEPSSRRAVPPTASPSPYLFTFGGEGTGEGLFQDAQDVAVDGEGNIFVSDDTLRIQKFNSQGSFLSLWTIPSSTQYFSKVRGGPDKVLANRQGKVFVVIGGVVLKYDGAKAEWLGAAHGSYYIHDAAIKADGGTVVISANGNNDELVILDINGKAVKRVHQFISSQLDKQVPVYALKVAVDGIGNIFAIYALGSVYGEHWYDSSDLAVFRFTADGKYVDRFGGGGNGPGQFKMPSAIAVDNQSRVYVSDRDEVIHVFTSDGRYLETIRVPFSVRGMAFDAAGDLFIVGSNKVSKLVVAK
jgi:hypothetical protein